MTMLAHKIAQQATRGIVARFSNPALCQVSVASYAVGNRPMFRTTSTAAPSPSVKRVSASEANDLLASQRIQRPTSPHLTIYRPQITWYLSILHRITGSILAGSLYVFSTAYLVSPLLGWHLESQSLATAFGALPYAAQFAAKFVVATPFVFHSANGIRHLLWDTGKGLTNQAVIRTGWTVVAITVIGAGVAALTPFS